ncbi:MAG TPA: hypothetical protein PLF13_00680 [candidate division Zixibacteria bacterium]|nr:hypothetical protein [candidate division Zixibacteria bacterium]
MESKTNRRREITIVNKVDRLSEEVKVLALNLAIYLAKAKPNSKELGKMEPDFVRLVNGTIKAVQEITHLVGAARHLETMAYDVPSGAVSRDRIELKLNSILDQCSSIMDTLSKSTDLTV